MVQIEGPKPGFPAVSPDQPASGNGRYIRHAVGSLTRSPSWGMWPMFRPLGRVHIVWISTRITMVALAVAATACGLVSVGPDADLVEAAEATYRAAQAAHTANAVAGAEFAAVQTVTQDAYARYQAAYAAFEAATPGTLTESEALTALAAAAREAGDAVAIARRVTTAATEVHVAVWDAEATNADARAAVASDGSEFPTPESLALEVVARTAREAARVVEKRDEAHVAVWDAEAAELAAVDEFVRAALASDTQAALVALTNGADATAARQRAQAAWNAAHAELAAATVRFSEAKEWAIEEANR